MCSVNRKQEAIRVIYTIVDVNVLFSHVRSLFINLIKLHSCINLITYQRAIWFRFAALVFVRLYYFRDGNFKLNIHYMQSHQEKKNPNISCLIKDVYYLFQFLFCWKSSRVLNAIGKLNTFPAVLQLWNFHVFPSYYHSKKY